MKRIILFIAILFSFSAYALAGPDCGPGRKRCNGVGDCVDSKDCAPGNPPPPGLVLPIDSNIYFLLAAGLGLGIYFLRFADKKLPDSYSAPGE